MDGPAYTYFDHDADMGIVGERSSRIRHRP
jgi:hypothetical protein